MIFGQAIDFFPAGQTADGDNIYNINSTVATNGPFSGSDAGGVYVEGSSLAYTSWDVQVQFDGGSPRPLRHSAAAGSRSGGRRVAGSGG